MDAKKMEVQNIEEKKLELLAQNPENLVYHYVDRPALAKPVPLSEVKKTIKELWTKTKTIHEPNPAKRRQIACENNDTFLRFSETHPDIFDRIVHPDTTQKEIDALYFMITLKEKENRGQIANGKLSLEQYIFQTFGMSQAEYRRKYPNHEIRDVKRPF